MVNTRLVNTGRLTSGKEHLVVAEHAHHATHELLIFLPRAERALQHFTPSCMTGRSSRSPAGCLEGAAASAPMGTGASAGAPCASATPQSPLALVAERGAV